MNDNELGPTVPRILPAQCQPAGDTMSPAAGEGSADPDRTGAHAPASETPTGVGTVARTPSDAARLEAASEARAASGVPGYVLLRELGRGGMGVVYEARHIKLNRVVALKMMLRAERAGRGELIRFLAEAEAVAAVKHENVVQVYDYGDADGRPFMVLEYCPGGTLGRLLPNGPDRANNPREMAALLVQVARGVAAAHALGIVHRDLKPGNVLLDKSGVPKVADFGLAKRGEGSDVTQAGTGMGTPAYVAPEQARDAKFVGPAADVWALGVIMYEALTGTRPFAGTVQEIMVRAQHAEPLAPRQAVPTVPRDLELICLHCLAKAPHERYATAKELADDLDRYLSHKPISVRPAGPVERAAKWVRRNRVVSTAAAAVFLALTLGLGFSIAFGLEAKKKQRAADDALGEKDLALGQKDVALGEKDAALVQEKRATEAAGRSGYRSMVALGFGEWAQGNLVQARQKLTECPVQYRDWEAHLLDRLCNKDVKRWPGQPMMVTAAAISPDGTRLVAATRDDMIHVWDRHTGQRLQTNRGHVNIVNSLAVSPDGTLVASSSAESSQERGEVFVWELATGHLLQRFVGADGFYHGLAFSPDSQQLAVGASKGVVSVWDPRSGEQLKTIKGHTGNGRSVQYSADGKYLAWTCQDESVELWDVAGAKRVCRFPPPMPAARATGGAFSPDGTYLAIGWGLPGERGELSLWEMPAALAGEPKQPALKVPEHASSVRAVSWSGDSARLATGDAAGVLRVWEVPAAKPPEVTGAVTEKHRIVAHTLAVTSLSFEKNGRTVTSASADGRLRVWDTESGKPLREVLGAYVAVRCVAISPDGKRVACGSASVGASTGVLVRDFETGNVVRGLYGHRHDIHALSYSGDGKRLASASKDRTVVVWDTAAGKQLKSISVAPAVPTGVALDHEGARLLIADSTGSVRLWNFAEDRFVGTWQAGAPSGPMAVGVAYEPGGARFVTAAQNRLVDGVVKVWDPAKAEPVFTLKQTHSAAPEVPGPIVAWSPDGKWIAAVGRDLLSAENTKSEITIWSASPKEPKPEHRLTGPPGIQSVSFSADSSVLVMGSDTGKVWVWDRKTASSFALAGHTKAANGAAAHPDGVHVVSCGDDAMVRVWHRHASRDALSFGSRMHRAAIDPDGTCVAIAGDSAVAVWDLNTGATVTSVPGTDKVWKVGHLALRPGRQLVTVASEFEPTGSLKTNAPRIEVAVRSLDRPGQVSRHVLDGSGGDLSPDGRLIVIRIREDQARVYDIDARKVVCDVSFPSERWPTFAFRSDGTRLAVSAGPNAAVYELPSGRKLYDLRGHATDIVPMAFSDDGRWIATGTTTATQIQTAPGAVHLWDAATGRRLHILSGHKSSISQLAFTPDGKRLLSAGKDGTLRLWDTTTGDPVLRFPVGYRHPCMALAFDRAGRLLVAELDAVRVWDGRPVPAHESGLGE